MVRLEGFQVSKSLMKAVEVSRWRGFCPVRASAVGKARRPFKRLSEKYWLSNQHVAALGMCRFSFVVFFRSIVISLFVLSS